MRWSGNGPGQRRGYHHGRLRDALVEAARSLVAERGTAGFTLAEAVVHFTKLAGEHRTFSSRQLAHRVLRVVVRSIDIGFLVIRHAWFGTRIEQPGALQEWFDTSTRDEELTG